MQEYFKVVVDNFLLLRGVLVNISVENDWNRFTLCAQIVAGNFLRVSYGRFVAKFDYFADSALGVCSFKGFQI